MKISSKVRSLAATTEGLAQYQVLPNRTDTLLNTFTSPPSYEKLQGDLKRAYSRRINVQHRLVYEVIESQNTIKIIFKLKR